MAVPPESHPDPWPRPVRFAILTVLVLVLGIGAVAVLRSRDLLPVAGVFVVMLLGPLVTVLGMQWRRGRVLRRLDTGLAALAEALPATPPGDATRSRAARARDLLSTGRLGEAVARADEVILTMRRSPPHSPDVAAAMAEVEAARASLGRLAAQVRARSAPPPAP